MTLEDSRFVQDESAGTEGRGAFILGVEEPILITGAAGFIGTSLVKILLKLGFRNLRCFTRRATQIQKLEVLTEGEQGRGRIQIVRGNLLSSDDCLAATEGVSLIYHLAAGRGEKSFADAIANSVVTTRNLLEATVHHGSLRRIVNVSSFAVYSNRQSGRMLDETSPVEDHPELRGEAYCYAKVRQDELLAEYGSKHGLPYVIVRPGYVFGPGKTAITGRVGIDSFGIFLHLGGSNRIPLTYVDNCAEAIALTGLKPGIDGEVFNVVDDELPTSRQFLRLYKRNVRRFKSAYVPHLFSYLFCYLWEAYSNWSEEQLPLAFNRKRWHANWKKTKYSNQKLKNKVGWKASVPMAEGLEKYFAGCRTEEPNA